MVLKKRFKMGTIRKKQWWKTVISLTSRGPSTALALAYALVEQFGGDAQSLRQGMLYQDVFGDA